MIGLESLYASLKMRPHVGAKMLDHRMLPDQELAAARNRLEELAGRLTESEAKAATAEGQLRSCRHEVQQLQQQRASGQHSHQVGPLSHRKSDDTLDTSLLW